MLRYASRAIEAGHLHSMILWGTPGREATLAEVIARYASADVSVFPPSLLG